MSSVIKRRRAGWWVAGLTVVSAAAAIVLLFRPLGTPRSAPKPVAPPKVNLSRLEEGMGDRILREQATMFDPTPLFLPTEWNTGQRPLPAAVQRQPGQVFGTFEAKVMYGEAELALPVGAARSLPASPVDMLKEPSRDPFLGFGLEDEPLTPLPSRQGLVEVRQVGTGEMMPGFPRELDRGLVLPAGRANWQPAEFLVSVTVGGLLGQPADTASSDIEELDALFRGYLADTLHLGERLPPGVYRVVVGP
jgi:hypothetical protein